MHHDDIASFDALVRICEVTIPLRYKPEENVHEKCYELDGRRTMVE